MSDPRPAEMEIEGPKRSIWRNLSLTWLIPIAALAITLLIAWQSWAERGARIEITFENAAGIVPGETALRFRDVNIGLVEDVTFANDLSSVRIGARIDNIVAESLPSDAEFWVVRPEVSASGISGLSTVLSGVYIEAAFEPQEGAEATRFEGRDTAPLVRPGMRGTRIVLRAPDGAMLSAGAPIFHQGIEVGRIETPRLLESGNGVIADAFIEAPHDRRVTTSTRFWDTSGFNVNFGPQGLDLSVGSVAALIRGGIAFDTVVSGGNPVPSRYVFDLFDDETAARDSVFSQSIDNAVDLVVEFDESVRGLEAGAPVTYRGLKIGAVNALGAFIDDVSGEQRVKLRASISIDPRALGLEDDTAAEAEIITFLSESVQDGLRARLASQGLFSQSLMVELVTIPEAEPAALGIFDTEAPVLPSVESNVPDVAATAEGLFQRIDDLPVEELMEQAIATLRSVESFAGDPDLRAVPGSVSGLLDEARGLIGSEETQALPGELNATVTALREIVEDLREAGTAEKLAAALDGATAATDSVSSVATEITAATEEVPALIEEMRDLVAKANALQLEAFVDRATALADSADRLIASDATQALPGEINATVAELRGVAEDLRAADAIGRLMNTLESASAAADSVTGVAMDLSGATEQVPALVDDLRRLVETANDLPLEAFVEQATNLVASADRLVDSDQTRALPGALTRMLDEARSALEELREGGVVENTNATLASARDAAAAIEEAAESLPSLSAQIQSMVGEAELALQGYGENSRFNRETLSALREVQSAAEALNKLARSIERNPNSLLFGR